MVGTLLAITGCGFTFSGRFIEKDNESSVVRKALTLRDVGDRLRTAGLAPEADGQVTQGFLNVPGTLLLVPGAELQVYIYPDSAARTADTAELDPVKIAPPTVRVTWVMPASLVTYENVAVILLTRDEMLRVRIRAALTDN
jgi:hypothetical protein